MHYVLHVETTNIIYTIVICIYMYIHMCIYIYIYSRLYMVGFQK